MILLKRVQYKAGVMTSPLPADVTFGMIKNVVCSILSYDFRSLSRLSDVLPPLRSWVRALYRTFFFLFIRFAIITSIDTYILKYNGRIPATAMSQLLQAQKLK